MRLKKKEAYIKAQENLMKRAVLMDKAEQKYAKAIERIRKAETKLSPEEIQEILLNSPTLQELGSNPVNSIVLADNEGF